MADFTTGGAKAQNADIFIGKKFGKYEIKEKLGQGAMGIVLKVWDTLEEVYKAIKMVPPEVAFDKLSFNQLKQEVNSSSKVIHPNVIKVMGLEEFQGLFFIVMELIDGETLADKLADAPDGKLNESKVLEYMGQICLGLNEAHKNGVIHLDLKPQNIMVKKNGEIKILDFSISHQITKSMTMLTGQNLSTGTLPYMAPEQLSKKFGRINEQTDVWGLGAVMYHLVSGEVPFEDRNQILDPDEYPYELEGVSELFKTIVKKCMIKDRAKRFKIIIEVYKTAGFSLGIASDKTDHLENDLIKKKQTNKKRLTKKGDLALMTNIDCDITVNDKKFSTKEKYLFIKDLPYGQTDIIAETALLKTEQKIVVEKQLTKIEMNLEKKKVSLYAKSMIGDFDLTINNQTYKCPELIENIPAGKYEIKIKYKDISIKDYLELINESEFEFELTEDKFQNNLEQIEKTNFERIMSLPEQSIINYNNKISEFEEFLKSKTYIKISDNEIIKKLLDLYQKGYEKIKNIPELDENEIKEKYKLFLEFENKNKRFLINEVNEEIQRLESIVGKYELYQKSEANKQKKKSIIYFAPVVIILIILVMLVIVPIINRSIQEGKVIRTKGDMKSIATGIEMYRTNIGHLPEFNGTMEKAYKQVSALAIITGSQRVTKDEWSNDFLIISTNKSDSYSVGSGGKDGKFNGWKQSGEYILLDIDDFNMDLIYSDDRYTYGPKM